MSHCCQGGTGVLQGVVGWIGLIALTAAGMHTRATGSQSNEGPNAYRQSYENAGEEHAQRGGDGRTTTTPATAEWTPATRSRPASRAGGRGTNSSLDGDTGHVLDYQGRCMQKRMQVAHASARLEGERPVTVQV